MKEILNYTIFKGLFDNSSIGIIITNKGGVITKINPFASKMFGYQDQELQGKEVEVLLPPDLETQHIKYRKQYNQAPISRTMSNNKNIQGQKKNGTRFPIEVGLSFYEINNTRYIISVINDITERNRQEKELKSQASVLELKVRERTLELTQAIEELNRTNKHLEKEIKRREEIETKVRHALDKQKDLNELKTRFVSMASHEFRTPLAGILTSVSLISRYNTTETDHKRNKHVKTIKKSVKYLTSVLNDFLSLDKLDQGKAMTKPSEFILQDFIQEAIADLQEMAQEKSELIYKHQGTAPLVLNQDKHMLKNILINLLSNAIKYSRTNHSIFIQTKKINNKFELIVKDAGIGIPENDQKHLFELFFRAHNATTIQGTGLGLNIVKKYLEYMKGEIHFTSEENIGTTFFVTIPLNLSEFDEHSK